MKKNFLSGILNMFTASDSRRKHNIEPIDSESKMKVENIRLKSFVFNDDPTQRKIYGVIAQDVEDAGLNELVYTDENDMKSVDYTSLLVLRSARNERLIDVLFTRVKNLEARLNELNKKE